MQARARQHRRAQGNGGSRRRREVLRTAPTGATSTPPLPPARPSDRKRYRAPLVPPGVAAARERRGERQAGLVYGTRSPSTKSASTPAASPAELTVSSPARVLISRRSR